MTRLAMVLAGLVLLSGCSTPSGMRGNNGAALIPDKAIQITETRSIPLIGVVEGALAIAAIHFIYDPLAPNWEIEEARVSEDTFRLSLRMKRYHTGGAGESMQVLKRRAIQLQSELGFGGYQLVEYSEGIESQTLGARRVADGIIRLVQRQPADYADSFLLNNR